MGSQNTLREKLTKLLTEEFQSNERSFQRIVLLSEMQGHTCPQCPSRVCTPEQLLSKHNLFVLSERKLWKEFREMSLSAKVIDAKGRTKRMGRDILIPMLRDKINPHLRMFRNCILSLGGRITQVQSIIVTCLELLIA